MKKSYAVLALLLAHVGQASAVSCTAFEYQEMKDMPVNELVTEACKAQDINDVNFKLTLSNLENSRGPKPFPDADKEYDVCKGQITRMTRILNSKGVTEKLPALCKRQAQGEVITAAPEAK